MVPTLMNTEIEHKILEELKAEMATIRSRRSKLAEHESLIGAMRDQRSAVDDCPTLSRQGWG